VEAALAWDMALNDGRPDEARAQLWDGRRRLRRIDLDHWLLLGVEWLRLEKQTSNTVPRQELSGLLETAERLGAGTALKGLKTLCL
jgi:hypothetical protein